jgi:hypothetical protein
MGDQRGEMGDDVIENGGLRLMSKERAAARYVPSGPKITDPAPGAEL